MDSSHPVEAPELFSDVSSMSFKRRMVLLLCFNENILPGTFLNVSVHLAYLSLFLKRQSSHVLAYGDSTLRSGFVNNRTLLMSPTADHSRVFSVESFRCRKESTAGSPSRTLGRLVCMRDGGSLSVLPQSLSNVTMHGQLRTGVSCRYLSAFISDAWSISVVNFCPQELLRKRQLPLSRTCWTARYTPFHLELRADVASSSNESDKAKSGSL